MAINRRTLAVGMVAGMAALALMAAAGGLAGAWLAGARPIEAQSGIMVAQEYRVVDRFGVLRGTFGVAPDGSLSFVAADRTGVPRAQFGVGANGEPFIELTDRMDRTRAVLRVLPDGTPIVALLDAAGQPIFGNGPESLPPPAARTSRGATAPGNCDTPARAADAIEQQMLDLINAYRTGIGLPPLQVSATLVRAARWKATELASRGPQPSTPLDHDDAFRSWEQRLLDCGYPEAARFGEVLGGTAGTAQELLQAFISSQIHRDILSDPSWTHIGIARAPAGTIDGQVIYRWVIDVGNQ